MPDLDEEKIAELMGFIDSEYDMLEGMSHDSVIAYLMESYEACKEEATAAVFRAL